MVRIAAPGVDASGVPLSSNSPAGALVIGAGLCAVALFVACDPHVAESVALAASASAAVAAPVAAPAMPRAAVEPPAPEPSVVEKARAEPGACPADMALVEGNHCRSVEQRCLEHLERQGAEDEARCVRFESPTACTSTAKTPWHMRFCMDRYEYPNRVGELPRVLVNWQEAKELCEQQDKRLCTESEFTFACEGEEMRPYTIGFERDAGKCNIDQPYLEPRRQLLPLERCEKNRRCARELKRLDRRKKIGDDTECISPFGILDLNGNVNEWVSLPWNEPPHRAALKGGWWGPVRNRCRATAIGHDERYFGYEVGFRCCQDAEEPSNQTTEREDGEATVNASLNNRAR